MMEGYGINGSEEMDEKVLGNKKNGELICEKRRKN